MSLDHLSRILSRLGLKILKSVATAYKSISGSVYEVEGIQNHRLAFFYLRHKFQTSRVITATIGSITSETFD